MQKAELKHIKISDIIVKPQVRTIFDSEPLAELTDSIRETGVLQPIAVNEVKSKLYLISGERRVRASSKIYSEDKKRNTIPAAVYQNLSDDEVLQMQIVENLQRKDVHPMEEAAAYMQMVETNKLEIKIIATKVGKTPHYVAARLKLNSLIADFQKAFFERKMNLTDAINVAKISKEGQKELWEDVSDDEEMEFPDYQLKKYKCNLSEASFDLKDKTLNDKGACSKCPHNTATNTFLFPEEAKSPKCILLSCFIEKTNIHFDRELTKVVSDPEVILVSSSYSPDEKVKEIEAKYGKVYVRRELEYIDEPEKPDPEDFDIDNYDSKKERDTYFNAAVKEYNSELKQYEKDILKATKAFRIDGNEKGVFCYVIIQKVSENNNTYSAPAQKTTVKAFQEKSESGAITIADINSEISRINTGEDRKQEIEDQKISSDVYDLLDADPNFFGNSNALAKVEKMALIVALHDNCGHTTFGNEDMTEFKEMFQQKFKYDEKFEDRELSLFLDKQSEEKLDAMINILSRSYFLIGLKESLFNYKKDDKAYMIVEVAHSYNPSGVNEIIEKETASRSTRKEKIEKSISKLEEQKTSLAPAKKKNK